MASGILEKEQRNSADGYVKRLPQPGPQGAEVWGKLNSYVQHKLSDLNQDILLLKQKTKRDIEVRWIGTATRMATRLQDEGELNDVDCRVQVSSFDIIELVCAVFSKHFGKLSKKGSVPGSNSYRMTEVVPPIDVVVVLSGRDEKTATCTWNALQLLMIPEKGMLDLQKSPDVETPIERIIELISEKKYEVTRELIMTDRLGLLRYIYYKIDEIVCVNQDRDELEKIYCDKFYCDYIKKGDVSFFKFIEKFMANHTRCPERALVFLQELNKVLQEVRLYGLDFGQGYSIRSRILQFIAKKITQVEYFISLEEPEQALLLVAPQQNRNEGQAGQPPEQQVAEPVVGQEFPPVEVQQDLMQANQPDDELSESEGEVLFFLADPPPYRPKVDLVPDQPIKKQEVPVSFAQYELLFTSSLPSDQKVAQLIELLGQSHSALTRQEIEQLEKFTYGILQELKGTPEENALLFAFFKMMQKRGFLSRAALSFTIATGGIASLLFRGDLPTAEVLYETINMRDKEHLIQAIYAQVKGEGPLSVNALLLKWVKELIHSNNGFSQWDLLLSLLNREEPRAALSFIHAIYDRIGGEHAQLFENFYHDLFSIVTVDSGFFDEMEKVIFQFSIPSFFKLFQSLCLSHGSNKISAKRWNQFLLKGVLHLKAHAFDMSRESALDDLTSFFVKQRVDIAAQFKQLTQIKQKEQESLPAKREVKVAKELPKEIKEPRVLTVTSRKAASKYEAKLAKPLDLEEECLILCALSQFYSNSKSNCYDASKAIEYAERACILVIHNKKLHPYLEGVVVMVMTLAIQRGDFERTMDLYNTLRQERINIRLYNNDYLYFCFGVAFQKRSQIDKSFWQDFVHASFFFGLAIESAQKQQKQVEPEAYKQLLRECNQNIQRLVPSPSAIPCPPELKEAINQMVELSSTNASIAFLVDELEEWTERVNSDYWCVLGEGAYATLLLRSAYLNYAAALSILERLSYKDQQRIEKLCRLLNEIFLLFSQFDPLFAQKIEKTHHQVGKIEKGIPHNFSQELELFEENDRELRLEQPELNGKELSELLFSVIDNFSKWEDYSGALLCAKKNKVLLKGPECQKERFQLIKLMIKLVLGNLLQKRGEEIRRSVVEGKPPLISPDERGRLNEASSYAIEALKIEMEDEMCHQFFSIQQLLGASPQGILDHYFQIQAVHGYQYRLLKLWFNHSFLFFCYRQVGDVIHAYFHAAVMVLECDLGSEERQSAVKQLSKLEKQFAFDGKENELVEEIQHALINSAHHPEGFLLAVNKLQTYLEQLQSKLESDISSLNEKGVDIERIVNSLFALLKLRPNDKQLFTHLMTALKKGHQKVESFWSYRRFLDLFLKSEGFSSKEKGHAFLQFASFVKQIATVLEKKEGLNSSEKEVLLLIRESFSNQKLTDYYKKIEKGASSLDGDEGTRELNPPLQENASLEQKESKIVEQKERSLPSGKKTRSEAAVINSVDVKIDAKNYIKAIDICYNYLNENFSETIFEKLVEAETKLNSSPIKRLSLYKKHQDHSPGKRLFKKASTYHTLADDFKRIKDNANAHFHYAIAWDLLLAIGTPSLNQEKKEIAEKLQRFTHIAEDENVIESLCNRQLECSIRGEENYFSQQLADLEKESEVVSYLEKSFLKASSSENFSANRKTLLYSQIKIFKEKGSEEKELINCYREFYLLLKWGHKPSDRFVTGWELAQLLLQESLNAPLAPGQLKEIRFLLQEILIILPREDILDHLLTIEGKIGLRDEEVRERYFSFLIELDPDASNRIPLQSVREVTLAYFQKRSFLKKNAAKLRQADPLNQIPLEEGQRYLKENKSKEALTFFREALQKNPESGESFYGLIQALMQLNAESSDPYDRAENFEIAVRALYYYPQALNQVRFDEKMSAYLYEVEQKTIDLKEELLFIERVEEFDQINRLLRQGIGDQREGKYKSALCPLTKAYHLLSEQKNKKKSYYLSCFHLGLLLIDKNNPENGIPEKFSINTNRAFHLLSKAISLRPKVETIISILDAIKMKNSPFVIYNLYATYQLIAKKVRLSSREDLHHFIIELLEGMLKLEHYSNEQKVVFQSQIFLHHAVKLDLFYKQSISAQKDKSWKKKKKELMQIMASFYDAMQQAEGFRLIKERPEIAIIFQKINTVMHYKNHEVSFAQAVAELENSAVIFHLK